MHQVKSNLYPCSHCHGSGTCSNGRENHSCSACIKENELKGKEHIGLPCSVCGGIGQAEPRTERINKRMPAILGFIVILLLIISSMTSAITNSPHSNEILAFSGPLIGTILGFYFSDKSRN